MGTKRYLIGAVGLLAATVGGCTGTAPHALIAVSASAPVEQYDLYVVDGATRTVLKHTGWADATKNGSIDISKQPFRIGLQLPAGGSFTVAIVGAIGKVNGIVPDRAAPGTRQFFWIATLSNSDNTVNATLLEVMFDDDADSDIFPDAVAWPMHQAAAASWNPMLLDCVDKKGGPVPPELINPFAKEICGDGIDEDCNGPGDDGCVDSDGDGDPDSSDCKPMDPKVHNPITDPKNPHYDPFPESANCCGYSLGKKGAESTMPFNDDPTCRPNTCGDGIDQDCNGADVACDKDQDCDTFPAGATEPNGCTAPANSPPGNDCNDCDKTVNPSAPELCDGIDNNCNGLTDETCVGCDLDGDGYQRNDVTNNCPDAKYKATGMAVDCNDEDAGVFPGSTGMKFPVTVKYLTAALAVCNDQSGNSVCGALRGLCRNTNPDGSAQDPACGMSADARKGCPPASCDKDGDGYIDAMQVGACDPMGMFGPYDCKDDDPTTFPNAPSKCGEMAPGHNCNGPIVCGVDSDGDGYDSTVDCDDNDKARYPWNKEVCDGKDNDCDGLIDEGNPDETGAAMIEMGHVTYCTDSAIGECNNPPVGHCVCSASSVAKLNFDMNRKACPGETPAVDQGMGTFARCYGAHQPSAQSCDPQNPKDDNCDGTVDDPTGKSFPMVGQPCWPGALGQCAKALGGSITGCDKSQTNCFAAAGKAVNPWYVCGNTAVCPVAEKCNGFDDHCDGSLQAFEQDLDKDGYLECGSTFSGSMNGLTYDNALPCEGTLAMNVAGCGDCADSAGSTMGVNNANIHPGAKEICNGIDDACDKGADGSQDPQCNGKSCCGANGCHDLTNEVNNCNMCGNKCNEANASAVCQASSCQIGMCQGGWGDCNGMPGDGCETNLTNSVTHCSGCGTNCNNNGWSQVATYACVASACAIAVNGCNANFADCDGTANDGCEVNLTTTVAHCGSCGKNCGNNGWANVASYGCGAGMCTIGGCSANFGDCDGNLNNGCESNLTNTPAHCGMCGTNCMGNGWPNVSGYGCSNSMCTISGCNVNYADCNGTTTDGCEINTSMSVTHCGGCGNGNNCNNNGWANVTSYNCANSLCTIAGCAANKADCDLVANTGCEADTTTAAHCGGCMNDCANNLWANVSAYSCNAGACGIMTCMGSFANCNNANGDGCEADTTSDVTHCGGCGNGNNCNNNGWQHVMTYKCTGSACGVNACNAGFKHCTGMVSNGCETDITNNPNCGACNMDCGAGGGAALGKACVNQGCGCNNGGDCVGKYADNCGGQNAGQCACGSGAPCDGTILICANPFGGYACLRVKSANCNNNNQCASGNCAGGHCT